MKIQILDRAKKKKFIAGLADLGMRKIPELLIRSGTERIRAYSGDLSTEQIMDFWRIMPIEGIGLYVGKELMNRNGVRETRLSLDGMHNWRSQLYGVSGVRGFGGSGRVVFLNKKQEEDWFLGKNIELEESQNVEDGFVCVKGGEDFIGMGKIGVSDKELGVRTLYSYLPKERRRKERG
ncbi:MAG: hypothetical protein KJ592_04495 [Nanoarchaeota archaeon]|nr:hypothetical protein [Nanoarchaeota archaeon]